MSRAAQYSASKSCLYWNILPRSSAPGKPKLRYVAGGTALLTTSFSRALLIAAAISAPVRCSPAMPIVRTFAHETRNRRASPVDLLS